jgi:HD-GYP domain-containing protein (c-di-GMP phosphodiesterase class II)
MPGNLLPHECLDDLLSAAGAIVREVRELGDDPVAHPDHDSPEDYHLNHPIDSTVAGLLVGQRVLPAERLKELGTGLFLKDIGMLALPPRIVHKPGPLEADEWELMSRHPLLGLEFVRDERVGLAATSVVRGHHERWDGHGYPDGRIGREISIFARIAALADAFDALTSKRWYAPARSLAEAIDAIGEESGKAFDPELTESFCDAIAAEPAMARSDREPRPPRSRRRSRAADRRLRERRTGRTR